MLGMQLYAGTAAAAGLSTLAACRTHCKHAQPRKEDTIAAAQAAAGLLCSTLQSWYASPKPAADSLLLTAISAPHWQLAGLLLHEQQHSTRQSCCC
jgi:hypothetical protein